jgi:hypothetical protein
MQYELVISFHQINLFELNVSDPESATTSALKLFSEGRLKPKIDEIRIFETDEDIRPDTPVYIHKIN